MGGRRAVIFLVLAIAGMATPSLAETVWRPYVNARFGSAADVPADWQADEAPANGDGQRFVSPDKTASVTISGIFRGDDSIDDGFAERLMTEAGETVTYQHRSPKALVVSGVRGGTVFYRKSVLGCVDRIWNDLVLEYPESQRDALDRDVTHMTASLHQGRGVESMKCHK